MSDPLPTDPSPTLNEVSEPDRDAKIEQLLLTGLDHYFAAQYEQAINVWTRALFLDRGHARARAYIERARSALAESQRESEELLQNGLAAFRRGDGDEARRLLEAALHRGAPRDEALAALDRLSRLGPGGTAERPPLAIRAERSPRAPAPQTGGRLRGSGVAVVIGIAVAVAAAAWLAVALPVDWASFVGFQPAPPQTPALAPAAQPSLPIPLRGETSLARARALVAAGHLHDALTTLDHVRPTDTERAEADRLRAEIQQQLIGLATNAGRPPGPQNLGRPLP